MPTASAYFGSGPEADVLTNDGSIECQSGSKFLFTHGRKIIAGIYVPCAAEEEFVECFRGDGAQWIVDASQCDPGKERLRARDDDELELIWKYPRPVRNEMIPCEGDISIIAGDHFGEIAMHDAEPTREARLGRDESFGCRRSKQFLCRSKALRADIARIRQRDPHTWAYHVSEAVN